MVIYSLSVKTIGLPGRQEAWLGEHNNMTEEVAPLDELCIKPTSYFRIETFY